MDFGTNVHVDDSVWNNTRHLRMGIEMAHGNEFAICAQGINRPSNSQVSYESALIEGEVFQDDPSDYANSRTRDVCYDDGRVTIRCQDGRGWGLYRDFVIETGARGVGIAGEFSGTNNGTSQPLPDQTDSTYGILFSSVGQFPITAAIYMTANGGYHHGFVARQDAFPSANGRFLALYKTNTNTPAFAVDRNGNLTHANGRPVVVRNINGFDCLTLG
jgi:hypothetical protein